MNRGMAAGFVVAGMVSVSALTLTPALAVWVPPPSSVYASCAALNRYYPHGLGTATAHDKVLVGQVPVTNFTRDTRTFQYVIARNPRLDADGDHIACERR